MPSTSSTRLTRIPYGSLRRHSRLHLNGSNNIRKSSPLQQHWKSDAVFGSSLSTIGCLLTLKYQSNAENLFETHPLLMEASVVALLVSFTTSTLSMRLRPPRTTLFFKGLKTWAAHVSLISGALGLVLLGSLLLNDKLKCLAFIFCGSPWALMFMQCLIPFLRRIHRRTVEANHAVLHGLGVCEALNQNSLRHQLPIHDQT